ncbi:MAG: N-6 DNA methylase [Cyclobacteriaceae bacterium]|nr:N-6 DNA methylase [Cyclobacteriaceae bacterium]
MQLNTETLFEKAVRYADLGLGMVNRSDSKPIRNSQQRILSEEIFAGMDNLFPDAIYFSGGHPFIQFKQLSKFDPEQVWKLHARIWNEGRSPILAITTPTEVRLYNTYDNPVESPNEVSKLQLDVFADIEQDLLRLRQCLSQEKIDTGRIWNEPIGEKLKTKNRVDKLLLQGLKSTRELLYDSGDGLPLSVIHDLLGRSLFTLYLEDRKILARDGFPDSAPVHVENFFDILEYKQATYDLFDKLKEKFNGDLFPVSSDERKRVNREHLREIRKCFFGYDHRLESMPLWKMFDFKFIPIELISAIYEEFMSGEEDGKLKARDEGAFYTKPMLVEFMLNEVLPLPDENNKRYDYKILDPSCGSGIFLVQCYKRLISRWKFSNPGRSIDADVLEGILLKSIYGVDKDTEAIKVAAFSLYLTFLNYLEPVEIRSKYIEHKRKKFKPLVHWTSRKEVNERVRANRDMGSSLFQCNTFDDLGFKNEKFDLIIGNPPWKSGTAPDEVVSSFVRSHRLPSQIACAYLEYMPSMLSNNGVIALVCTAKILFNTSLLFEKFRGYFFSKYYVNTIINLAVVRDIMFDNARTPGAVFIYRLREVNQEQKRVLYCVPKSITAISKRQTMLIDATDVKFLPYREIIAAGSKIFKIAMWGGARDLQLINRLLEMPNIDSLAGEDEKGIGLHKKDSGQASNNRHLVKHKFIELDRIEKYYTPGSGLKELGSHYSYFRTNSKNIFKPPVILLKRGSKDRDFCFSYCDYNCVYTDRIYGLSLGNRDQVFHKALVACLNSSIANYFLFMISSVWAVDKTSDLLHEEIMSFPALPLVMSDSTLDALAKKVDNIVALNSSEKLVMARKSETTKIEREIDEIIYNELNITENERFLINDALNNSIGLKKRYDENNAEGAADLNEYARTLAQTLTQTTKFSNRSTQVEIIEGGKTDFRIIIIHFDKDTSSSQVITSKTESNNVDKLLTEINNYAYSQHGETVFYRKVFRYYNYASNSIYLIKPNQKRFWIPSQALYDADTMLAEMIASNEHSVVSN